MSETPPRQNPEGPEMSASTYDDLLRIRATGLVDMLAYDEVIRIAALGAAVDHLAASTVTELESLGFSQYARGVFFGFRRGDAIDRADYAV